MGRGREGKEKKMRKGTGGKGERRRGKVDSVGTGTSIG